MPIVLKFEDSNICFIIQNHNKKYMIFTGTLNDDIINITKKLNINSVNQTNSKSMFMLDDGELDVETGKNIYVPFIDTDKQHIADLTLELSQINKNLTYINSIGDELANIEFCC